MRFTTYNNINANFTYENIHSHVNEFWSNEVTKNKEQFSGIWLTIIVFTKKNISFKLINSLPFNTNDNTDVFIALKRNLDKNYLNNKDVLDSITFRYGFYKKNYNYKESDNIHPLASIYKYFITWLKSYFITEIKSVKNDFTPSYSNTLNKHVLNSKVNTSNTLNLRNLKKESDMLNVKNYSKKNTSHKRKY